MAAFSTRWLPFSAILAFVTPLALGDTGEFPLLMPGATPEREESYYCTPIRVNDERNYYVTGFAPNVSTHVAHHMLVYGCEEPGSEEPVWNCGEMAAAVEGVEAHAPCKTKPQIIYAWAHSAKKLELPEDVAFR